MGKEKKERHPRNTSLNAIGAALKCKEMYEQEYKMDVKKKYTDVA